MRKAPVVFTLLLLAAVAQASDPAPQLATFNVERIARNETALAVLAGWSALSLVAGGLGAWRSSGEARAFWGMTLAWGAIDLAIAGAGWRGLAALDPQTLTLAASISEATSLQRLVAINLGLDAAYLVTGLWLRERGGRTDSSTLQGFGNAVLVQGAFLLVFDAILLAINVRGDQALLELVP